MWMLLTFPVHSTLIVEAIVRCERMSQQHLLILAYHIEKYVLCRPDAGLNFMLCQIETAYQYAERTDRVVVVR